MRRLCIIVIPVLLIYGGVAQALGGCSVDWGHSGHNDTPHSTHRKTIQQPGSGENLQHGSSPVIECLKLNPQFGPMIEVSRIRTTRPSNNIVPLQKLTASGSATVLNSARNYGLKFLALHGRSISLPTTLSLHVFLSVFQI